MIATFVLFFVKKLSKIRKSHDGVGAKCEVLTKYLHPSKKINEICPNYTRGSRTEDLICIGKEEKVVNKVKQNCITFRHKDFENVTLYCVSRWVHVITEGSPDHFFDKNVHLSTTNGKIEDSSLGEEEANVIPDCIFRSQRNTEDIQFVRGLGFEVDDDNDPAPENVPATHSNQEAEDYVPAEWKWDGMCSRKSSKAQNMKPSMIGVSDMVLTGMSFSNVFLLFFPAKFMEDVILVQSNKRIVCCNSLVCGFSWLHYQASRDEIILVSKKLMILVGPHIG